MKPGLLHCMPNATLTLQIPTDQKTRLIQKYIYWLSWCDRDLAFGWPSVLPCSLPITLSELNLLTWKWEKFPPLPIPVSCSIVPFHSQRGRKRGKKCFLLFSSSFPLALIKTFFLSSSLAPRLLTLAALMRLLFLMSNTERPISVSFKLLKTNWKYIRNLPNKKSSYELNKETEKISLE